MSEPRNQNVSPIGVGPEIAALRASHERLRLAVANLEPWWGGHAGQESGCPICSAIREARAAIAEAKGIGP